MIRQRLALTWLALAVAPLASLTWAIGAAQASTVPTQSCSYDPASGKTNPLGDRAAITINEINGDTVFTYQEIPSRSNRGPSVVVVAPKREITLERTSLEAAKKILLENPSYYNDLLGYESTSGFAAVNNSLTCWDNDLDAPAPAQATLPARQVPATTPIPSTSAATQGTVSDPAPNPAAPNPAAVNPAETGTARPRQLPPGQAAAPVTPAAPASTVTAAASPSPAPLNLLSLPDGNYRLWNGKANGPIVSDETLLKEGGALFIFNKKGDRITGNFAYIDSDSSYCVLGQGNKSTVSGFAYPYNNEVLDLGETFRNLGPSDFLKVRRTRVVDSKPFYSSALLDLSSFSKINLGPVSPPTSCKS